MKHIKGIIWWITLPFMFILCGIVLIFESEKAADKMSKVVGWHNSLAEDDDGQD